ncbi:MAG: 16S rRNA processing protein RimM [Ruminococcus sp.]|nr:16S rRNA processing protein RimM [Ruminococcus sp.]
MKKEYLEAGKIVSTHGIKGEVKIMPYCDSPELLCEFDRLFLGKAHSEINIERSRVQKNMVIAKLEGFNTPEEAEKLRNKLLYMHRDDLELDENTYFIQDLIGLEVRDADSDVVYGTIDDVIETGANDVYSIKGGSRSYLIPAIADVVVSTDIDGGVMLIRPLEGLFDEN